MLLISYKNLDLLGLKINTLRASNWLNTFYLGRKNQQRRKITACSATHTVKDCLLRHWTGRMKDGLFKSPFHWSGPYMLSRSTRGLFWRSLWKAVSLSGSLFKECRWGSFWRQNKFCSEWHFIISWKYWVTVCSSHKYQEWPVIRKITV